MKAQSRLIKLYVDNTYSPRRGDRTHNPLRVLFTHENKGKKYPYASVRQNTRAKWQFARYMERMRINPEVLDYIAAE